MRLVHVWYHTHSPSPYEVAHAQAHVLPLLTDTLVAVLERDTLGIREVRLFNAVVRWSEAECQRQQLQVTPENKRKVLGKALGLIRFPLMTIEEFAAGNKLGELGHGRLGRSPTSVTCPCLPCNNHNAMFIVGVLEMHEVQRLE